MYFGVVQFKGRAQDCSKGPPCIRPPREVHRRGPVETQQGTRRVRVKDPIESTHGAGTTVFDRRLCGRGHFDPPTLVSK